MNVDMVVDYHSWEKFSWNWRRVIHLANESGEDINEG